jgi:hypothetical protein
MDNKLESLRRMASDANVIVSRTHSMLQYAIENVLIDGQYVRTDNIGGCCYEVMTINQLSEVINGLEKVEPEKEIVELAPKWDFDKEKGYFVEAMIPFIGAIEKCHKENGQRGEIDFRQCTINDDDYLGAKLCSKDLDAIFDVIWKEYFLDGHADFNDNSEFSWDMYYNEPDNSGATFGDCVFYYKDCKIYLGWNSMYEPYMPTYLNYYVA